MKNLISLIILFTTLACSKQNVQISSECSIGMPAVVDNAIVNALANHPDTPGVVVAIYHPAYGYIQKAYGVENRSSSSPMNVDHIFDIGSIMKNFRWVVIHKLAERGDLDLTDNVNSFVVTPVLTGRNLKHLMQHSTGMIDINDSGFMTDAYANLTKTYSYDEMISFLTTSSGVDFTNGLTNTFSVGTNYRYSSFGPLIAGKIAEEVTGKEIKQLIKEFILTPLRMKNTYFVSYDKKPANVAQGYDDATTEMNFFSNYADTRSFSSGFGGVMYSSACDLARYANNEFNNNSFLSPSTLNAMMTETITSGGIEVGLGIFKYGAWGNFWGHMGSSIHGHSSALVHRSSDKLSIAVLANIDDGHDNHATHFEIINAIGAAL